jgi:hypothetical protein
MYSAREPGFSFGSRDRVSRDRSQEPGSTDIGATVQVWPLACSGLM